MKKIMNIFLAVLITLFSFPIGGLNVSAEGKEQKVDYIIKHATKDEASSADNFFTKPGILIEKDGKLYLQVTITSWNMVEALSSEGTDVIVLSENDNNTAEVEIELNKDLSTATNLKMTINVPGVYHTTHDARLFILEGNDTGDGNGSEVGNEDEDDGEGDNSSGEGNEGEDGEGDSGDGNNGEDGSEGEGNEDGNENGEDSGDNEGGNDNGSIGGDKEESESLAYVVDVPTMKGYIESIKLVEIDGENKVTFRFNTQEYIANFEIDQSGEYVETNEVVVDGDFVEYTFDIKDLSKTLKSKISIDAGFYQSEYEFNIDFVDYKVAKDLSYTVDVSAMEGYIESIKLVEIGGENKVTFRFNTQEYIANFEIDQSGEYVETNEVVVDGDFVEYTFDIKDLSKTLKSKISIDAGFYQSEYEFNIDFVEYKSEDQEVIEIVSGQKNVKVSGNQTLEITDSESGEKVTIKTPQGLPDNTDIFVEFKDEKEINTIIPSELEVAGAIVDVTIGLNGKLKDGEKFTITLPYDTTKYNQDDVDIYYYDENTKEWKAQKGTAENGVVSLDVNHFSTYGVFAQKKDTTNDDKQKSDELKVYEIDYVVKHETKDENSSANAFFEKPGYILKQDGETYFQTYITSWQMIDWLKYEGTDVEVIKIESDSQGETAFVQMKINADLTKEIGLNMHITVPGMYEMEHDARLVFDKNSKKEINAKGYKIYKEDDSKGSGGQGSGTTPPAGKPGGGKGQGTTQKSVVKSDKVAADKAYKINYVVYKEDVNEPSAADQFFKKPGTLLKKDGKQYLQITITNWSMIDYLNYNGKPVQVIKVDKNNNSALVQLQIDGKLSDVINLDMKITVPGLYEGQEYKARLVLDPDSMEEIDAEGHYIYQNVSKPGDFGDANGDKKGKTNPTNNPKTGDTSQLMFFTLLLIGSLITLSIQIKKRLA